MFLELIILLVSLLIFALYKSAKRPKNFPPGPTNWPIVGAIPYIAKLDPVIDKAVLKLGDKYGNICGAYFGKNLNMIVNGYEAITEIMTRDDFAGRPLLKIATHNFGGKHLGVFFTNGQLWKEQRRFTLRNLRDFGFGKATMENLVLDEVEDCLTQFQKKVASSKDSTVTVHDSFGAAVINVLWAVMCGKRFSYDDKEFNEILDKLVILFRAGNPLGNFINDYPLLRFFPVFSTIWNDTVGNQKALLDVIEKFIDDHEKTRDDNYSRDFIDVYLKEIESQKEKGIQNSTFFKQELLAICSDLLGGGAETTGSSISFGLLYLILNPKVQEKLQKELDSVVGKDRLPAMSDKPNLPYAEAVLTELFRISTISPIAPPHMAIEDTKFQGYDIPKNTIVTINLTSVHMDKKYWGDPETFRPERFLDANGKFVKPERVIAFGMGKRNCLGEPLARMNVFCFLMGMVQRYKFEVPPGQPKPSTVPLPGFTVAPQPFHAKVTPRF